MNLPGYDTWKTSGNPHTGTTEVKCDRPECPAYNQVIEVPAHIEYGTAEMLDDACPTCDKVSLVSTNERLPERLECGHLEDNCTCEEEA